MKTSSRRFRLARLLAATSLTMTATGGMPAQAQPAGDPPSRVGRLAQLSGSVSTHGSGATEWSVASLNLPLTSGDAIWTQPTATAAIQVADNLIALSESTEFDLATLDNQQLIATEPQGELFLDIRDVAAGDSTTIATPRGVVKLSGVGQYDIVAGDSATPTTVSVVAGSAQIVSGSFSLTVATNQTATVTGSDALQGSVGPLAPDPFLSDQLRRLAPPPSGPQAIRHMTGCASLAAYGSWQASPQYGQVWYPHVDHDWAPYRDGSWHYVAPWGWTWVDDEPWGFAPFHYGRWSQFDGRWGWVPAEPQAAPDVDQQPVYAPALVDFVVAGAAVGAGIGLLAGGLGGRGDRDGGGGDVGWIPLGPRERYQPQFAASQGYLQRVNPGQDERRAAGITAIGGYANHGALTVVPAAAMARSEPVGRVARTGAALQAAAGPDHRGAAPFQPVRGTFALQPVAATRGVTPAVAQHFALAHGPDRPAAPGPAVNPALFRPHELPAGRTPFRTQPVAAQPVAARADRPQAAAPGHPPPPAPAAAPAPHPAPAAGPAPQQARPNGLPALRAPGAVPPGAPPAAPHVEAGPRPGPAAAAPAGLPPAGRPGAPAAHEVTQANRAQPPAPPAARPAAPPVPRQAAPHPKPVRPPTPAPRQAPPAARVEPPRPAAHEAARPPQPQPRAAPREAPRPQPVRPAPPPHAAPPPPRPAPRPAPPPPRPAPPHPAPPGHRDEHPR